MLRFGNNLSIPLKLYVAIGTLAALLLVVGGAGFLGALRSESGFSDYRRLSEQVTALAGIQEDLLEARMAAYRFRASGDLDAAAEVGMNIEEILDAEAAIAETVQDDAVNSTLLALEDDASSYGAIFGEMVAVHLNADAKITNGLNEIGPRARRTVTDLLTAVTDRGDAQSVRLVAEVQQHLLLGRLYGQKFLLRNDTVALERAREELSIARDRLAAVAPTLDGNLGPMADSIEGDLSTYRETLAQIAALKAEETDLAIDGLDSIGPRMASEIDQLVEMTAEAQRALTEETIAMLDGVEVLVASVVAGALLVGGLLAFMLGSGIAGPIRSMTLAMRRLADGDTTVEVPGADRGDEIGGMAGAVAVFRDGMIEAERLRAEQSEAERRAEEQRKRELTDLAETVESSVGGIADMLGAAAEEMRRSAESLSDLAKGTSGRSAEVATASEQAAANVQTVASASEELAASIKDVARQVDESAGRASQAVSEARQTGESVDRLKAAADRIGDVVSLITAIAEQTNLLALNATIEAARAGEAGKGFAVVAGEVKSLASQTQKATGEIGDQVRAIQAATEEAVEAIGRIGATIGAIDQSVGTIAAAAEQQSGATGEIARNVQEAATGTQSVNRTIGEVSSAASETGRTAQEVLGAAGELATTADKLRGEVSSLVDRLRVA